MRFVIMEGKFIKFLKIYMVFLLLVLLTNLSMEILVPTPERERTIAEHGWDYFLQSKVTGIVIFYMTFNFAGSVISLLRDCGPSTMGILSFVAGFILEFAFMKPEWVMKIYAFEIGGDVVGAVIVSSFYWFIAWGLPAYIIHKFLIKHHVQQGKL